MNEIGRIGFIPDRILLSDLPGAAIKVLYLLKKRIGSNRCTWVSLERIAADTKMGRDTVRAHLRRLESEGMIARHLCSETRPDGARRRILISIEPEAKWTLGIPREDAGNSHGGKSPTGKSAEKSPTGCRKIPHARGGKSPTAVYETEKDEACTRNKGASAPRKRDPHLVFAALPIPESWRTPALEQAWDGFIDMRLKAKAKPTERAVELLGRKLEQLAPNPETAAAILDQSTENGYRGVFELKAGAKPAKLGSRAGQNPLIQQS